MARLRGGGQALVTTTDLAQVPGAGNTEVARVRVEGGEARAEAAIAA